jgi:diguanylate cyclase (GGDEF)-like protein/PAS domain S-box-containing protein
VRVLNCDTNRVERVRLVGSATVQTPGGAAEVVELTTRVTDRSQSGTEILFMHPRGLIIRHAVVSLLFVLLYLLLDRPEVIFLSRIGFVAWYPAIGLVMALLLGISPWYALPACFSVALAGRVIYAQPVMSFSNTIDAVGIGVCYGVAAYVLRSPLQIDLGLRRRRDVVRYVLVSATAAAAATIIGVACLIADHSITPGEYKSSALGWFLGDAIGLVGIAPFLLVHVLPHIRNWLSPTPSAVLHRTRARSPGTTFTLRALAESCGQSLTILFVLWVMFGTKDGRYDHFYLCFIPIIWIAMCHGVRRVVTGLLALNFGIVIAMHLFPPTPVLFAKVALLMLVLSAVGLIVGSEVSERHRLAIDLNEQTIYLDSLIQNSPLGIVVLNRHGCVELANSAFEKLFQCDRHELAAADIGSTGIDDGVTDSAQLIPQIFDGNALHKTVRQRRKDGRILDLALHGVPLLLNSEVRGAYLIYEDISEQIRANEVQRQHAESLNRLVKELKLHTEQMTTLNEMGSLLECSGTVPEACTVVARSLQRLFPEAPSGALYLFKPSRNLLEAVLRWGTMGCASVPTFSPDDCWSLRRGQPHWSERPRGGVSCQHLAERSTADCLCVPMVAQGNTLGVLHLEFESTAQLGYESVTESSRDSHQRLAINAASQIALSLASLQLRQTLREQSIRDPLTRLFNRRFLEESLERELQLASRKKQVIAILFLDLDHFKRFNDAFGHDAGDLVLQSLADLFRSFFRATDICCRYGGEEFAIILPESSSQDAVIRADALRSEVKSLRLQHKKQTLGPLTLSVGVAAFPEHGLTADELLKIADQCLYESKSRGRDVVTVALPQNA